MKRYPAYKDSGVEWIGRVPKDWEPLLFKRVIHSMKDGTHGTFQRVAVGCPLLSAKNVQFDGLRISEDESQISEEDFAEIVKNGFPRKNDLLLTIVGTIGRAFVYDKEYPLAFQRSVLFIRLRSKVTPRYYYYFTQTPYFMSQLMSSAKTSAQSGVYMGDVAQLIVLVQLKQEQQCMTSYLDRKTSQIDALIAKKQRQIELLQEQRAAIISQAVTKGLDPNVPMKDTGVPWLGEVPEHWDVKRLKYLLKTPLRYGANESAEYEEPTWPRYVRITDINEEGDLRKDTFKSLPEEIAQPYLLQQGDLLFARSGATVGKTFLYKESWGTAAYAGYLILARFDLRRVVPSFIAYFCRSSNYWSWLGSTFIQATIQNVSAERYANLTCPLPELAEQREIVRELDGVVTALGSAIKRIKTSIILLQEYRTTLISEVVTGKIDVREEISTYDTTGATH